MATQRKKFVDGKFHKDGCEVMWAGLSLLQRRRSITFLLLLVVFCLGSYPSSSHAQIVSPIPISYGYNGVFLAGGDGLVKPITAPAAADVSAPWSLYCWVWLQEPISGPTLVAGMGDPLEEYARYFALKGGRLVFRSGAANSLETSSTVAPMAWHLLAATFDGTVTHIYLDGNEVASGKLMFGQVSPVLEMAPPISPWNDGSHFAGKIASFTWMPQLLDSGQIQTIHSHPPDFALINFELGSPHWPVQTRSSVGMSTPQDPATLPRSNAPFSKPVAKPLPPAHATLMQTSDDQWTIAGNWSLTEAAKVKADGAEIASDRFNAVGWLPATVPGTVLTTMIDRGIYPDPDYGLNNMAIPETLNKQDYWYRVTFTSPKLAHGQHLTLTFNGINYAAVVWFNGHRLGTIKGAFIRGTFDVTDLLSPAHKNALAVWISPPPHPGIPQEQSVLGGPGPNGGMMCLDGPTFVATEGWDWIPAVRDRDTGIWQDVTLKATGQVKIGDVQVITTLPLPDITKADVYIHVPLENMSTQVVHGNLTASFGQTTVTKSVSLQPGETVVKLSPAEFSQLTVEHPNLWWPNGYGKPNLYQLKLQFSGSGGESDTSRLHFGIREVTYELSLLDPTGHLRRVEISPTVAKLRGEQIVDVSHNGMREIPKFGEDRRAAQEVAASIAAKFDPARQREIEQYFMQNWVASLLPAATNSPAVRPVDDTRAAPYLILKVNGVRIAVRGGNWGMDDMLKRVSRKRLEPYFRLDRDANLNIIRNWVGQNTEQVFYDLADEYGLMVWNDFWDSTENYNLEPQDPALFLANARDTILRYRNHPSIVMWCGRNEGVPQPILNEGLANLIDSLDGTRYYSPSSNRVNLQNSGPYQYQNPSDFYTTSNRGFSVEVGTPSMSTLESFRSTTPAPDQWPIDDVWAYHDWHQSGNGDVAPFMHELDAEFGAPTSLADFERKAQMLNYVDHRAIFEGFNANLWAPNSGRLLWMTQPAWPSTVWQILSHDYDTQASFYGVKKACEPIHVQLNLANYQVSVVDTTRASMSNATVTARIYSLQNKLLQQHEQGISVAADSLTPGFRLDLAPLMSNGMIFVKLDLKDSTGNEVSDNFYWLGQNAAAYTELNQLATVKLTASVSSKPMTGEREVDVQLKNPSSTAALAIKLTLQNASDGSRILPAYLSDNYVSLLPGEARTITIEYPGDAAKSQPQVALRGWNIAPNVISLSN
ncbi:MAG: LamG-like jellyroll fold domain-containing protein [Acidobacteriaceae bacterium]